MQLDQPPVSGLSEEPTSSLALSPVIETQEEDSTLEEERFADALEEHTIAEEKEDKTQESKRDSKFEDDFEEVAQIVETKEVPVMQDVVVNPENPPSTKQETAQNENNNKTTQTQTQQEDEDTSNAKPVYPSQPVLILLITGLCLSVLLVSLDRTIITTVCNLLIKPVCRRYNNTIRQFRPSPTNLAQHHQ